MCDSNLTIWNLTFTVNSLSVSLFLQWWKILIFYTDPQLQIHTDFKNITVNPPRYIMDISLIAFNKIKNSSNLLLWVISLTDQAPRNVNVQSFPFIAFVFLHFDIIYLSIYHLNQKENIIFKIYLKYNVKKASQPHKIWLIIFVNIHIITYCYATIEQNMSKSNGEKVFVQIFHPFTLDDGCPNIIICYMKDWYMRNTPSNKKNCNFVC